MSAFTFLKDQLQILDIIQEYTSLKRAGLYWKGHCPFHHEKTASFTVSPHKGIFYCFGCHNGGDIITFIAKIEQCTPLEAVQHLANRYNITLPEHQHETHQKETQEKDRYYTLCKVMASWCNTMLANNAPAQNYMRERGISAELQKQFSIGYFPGGLSGIRSLLDFMKKHHILADDLIQTGSLQQGRTVLYSAFEERIIFPITDHLGRCCGFGGRIFKPEDTRAKYYNSRENQFFTKGSLLFGLDQAKKAIQTTGTVFLVEGYTDCIAMVQQGYSNTVATLGTACTREHLTLLSRYANRVMALYDSDNAGQEAILRLAELSWQASIDPYVICLPSAEDPASFLKKGGDLKPYIDAATDILVFFIQTLGGSFTEQPLREKLKLTRKIINIIALVDDQLKRDFLLGRAACVLEVPLVALERELQTTVQEVLHKKGISENRSDEEQEQTFVSDQKLEKKIFFAILNTISLLDSKLGAYLPHFFPEAWVSILSKLMTKRDIDPSVTFASFFSSLTLEEQQLVSSILMAHEGEVSTQEFTNLMAQLQRKYWKKIAHTLKIQLAQAHQTGDHKAIEKILSDFLELKQTIVPTDFVQIGGKLHDKKDN